MGNKRGMVVGWLALSLAGCASHGGAGATTGGLQTTDGGVMLKAGEKCGNMTACSTTNTTKSYKTCTVTGSTCSERFITSDNQAYDCTSCSDCQAAAMMVTSWCGGSTTGGGGNDSQCATLSSGTACSDCCATNHPTGNTFYTNALAQCECVNPGDCQIECANSLCNDGSIDSTCDQCVQESQSFGDCDETAKCMANSDCSAMLDCINACPL